MDENISVLIRGTIFVYTEVSPNRNDNVCGTVMSGCRLNLQLVNGKDFNGSWYLIKEVLNDNSYYHGSVKEKYIKLLSSDFMEVPNTTEATSENDDDEFKAELDDAFVRQYGTYLTSEEYMNNLSEGLKVSDLRGILGMPHQFLPLTDPRIDGSMDLDSFGRKYTEKIIQPIPLLLMTPGTPSFMASYNDKQRSTILSYFHGITEGALDALVNENSGKYYSLKYDYVNYFYYVNAMLRSAAYFLGIQDEKIDGRSLSSYDWFFYTAGDAVGDQNSIFNHGGLNRFLGTYAGAIPFYCDSETTVDDSFSNDTTQSELSGLINGLSDKAREMNFLLGNVSGMAGLNYDKLTQLGDDSIQSITDNVNRLLGNGNVISNILGNAQTLLKGGKMIFPEIWSGSDFSRSYSIKMKLISPSGDKLSVYLNILVPIYFLLAFTLPRQSAAQAYSSPFLVRAFYKGLFNVDMGIITRLSITKGAEGEWTVDGLPTVADVSFEIKDLYNGMFMSTGGVNDTSIMSNITELDYIANSCGINVNEPEILRTVQMYIALGLSDVADHVELGIFGNATQWFNNTLNNIFGRF